MPGRWIVHLLIAILSIAATRSQAVDEAPTTGRAFIDGSGLGWQALSEADFEPVNCEPATFVWSGDGVHCTGKPVGVIRTKKQFTNFEIVATWRHQTSGGNSGIFLWATPEGMANLKPNALPSVGIEVQVLDHGYADKYRKSTGKDPDWFTTHGDVFPVRGSKMEPFPPVAPRGSRSFPRKNLSKGVGEWNHYYVRAINGEVRLWVNGDEVSGGTNCQPRSGHVCLESEGAPVDFKGLRLRVLP